MNKPAGTPKAPDRLRSVSRGIFEKEQDGLKRLFSQAQDQFYREMPIEVFRQDWLPIFSAEVVLTKEQQDALFDTWFGIAGNLFAPVRLVDEFGQTLDTVPPLLSRDAHKSTSTDVQIRKVYEETTMNPLLPTDLAQKKWTAMMSHRIADSANYDQQVILKHRERWTAFLIRMGVTAKSDSIPVAKSGSDDDFLVYD